MTVFDRAWGLVKSPYYIYESPEDEREEEDLEYHVASGPHEYLYQGGKEGDPDSFFWTPDKSMAILYAILGSDMYESPREGKPQLRRAKTSYNEYLEPDIGHEGQGVAATVDKWMYPYLIDERHLDSEIIPITEEDLIDMSRDRSIHSYLYDEPNSFSGNRAEQQEALKPYLRDWR